MFDLDSYTKLKINLFKKDKFLAIIAYQANVELTSDIDTAGICIKDKSILLKINDTWINSFTKEQQLGILAHECMHIALQHPLRKGDRLHELWNVACDMVINSLLLRQGFKLPNTCLLPAKYHNETSEELYSSMEQEVQNDNTINYNFAGDITDSDLGNDPSSNNPIEQDKSRYNKDCYDYEKAIYTKEDTDDNAKEVIKNVLVKASSSLEYSSLAYNSEIQRELEALMHPKINWRVLLRKYVAEHFNSKYSWRKPQRRFMSIAYLPSKCGIGNGELQNANVYIDISGSVSNDLLNQFITEIKKLHSDLHLQELNINFFSNSINSRFSMKDKWVKPKKPNTGWGTDIEPVITDIIDNPAKVHIIITDGCFYEKPIEQLTNQRIVWCIFDNTDFTTEKGKVVHLEIN